MSRDSIYLIGVPKSFGKSVRQTVASALRDVRKNIGYAKPIGVAVFEAPGEIVIPEIGMSGSAIGRSGIEIRIDFKRKFEKRKFADELSASVHHETAHLAREDAVGYNASFLDAMINEGVACHVERALSPKRHILYAAPIKNEGVFLRKASLIFNEKKYDHSEWFFGSKKIPKWIGYRLGYLMVEAYTKNRHIPLSQLVRIKTRNFQMPLQNIS